MSLSKNQITGTLIIASLAVLLIDYSFIKIKGFGLSLGVLQLSEIETSSILPAITAFAVVIGSLIFHCIFSVKELIPLYQRGYGKSPKFQELAREKVAEACGSNKYGSPCGDQNHTLWPQSYNLGRFQHNVGYLTEPVIISPCLKIHISGILYGLCNCFSIRLFLAEYAPALLAIWALCIVAV